MTNRIWKYSLAAALAAVVLAVVGIACAAEEPADPQQPAAARAAAPAAEAAFPTGQEPVVAPSQEQQQPAQAAPARAPSLPNPAQAAAAASGTTAGPTARTGEDPAMVMAMEGYMPPKLEPGAYPATRFCDHCPTPKQFNESPTSASLARQGAILPLEQRLAVPEDVLIYMPGDEIGQYGGQMRATTRGNIELIEGMTMMSGLGGSPDAIFNVPVGFKAFETNEDATVFTINIRRGMRWHSGYPFTMEDIRFALEDQMLNKELMPGLPAVLKSPITGNDMRINFVDDSTFTVNFDDPNWSFAESSAVRVFAGIKGCPRCFVSPSHVQKRFHIKYNASEIPALLEEYDQPNWTKLVTTIRCVICYNGHPSEAIPMEFDPNYIYKGEHYIPSLGGWYIDSGGTRQGGGDLIVHDRNHYYYGADPEGNQLPYAEGWLNVTTGSREVAVFRTMGGESDYTRHDLATEEMPLYLANSEKGDYSVLKHDLTDGADSTFVVNQEYVEDPEIGHLLRTKDFRIALSLAWNRDGTNEALAAGLGVPQNMMPHSSTPYFAGEEYRIVDTEYDLDRAKSIMEKMGYTDGNGDGYYDKKDGSGPLTLNFLSYWVHWPYAKWVANDWDKLGIKVTTKEESPWSYTNAIPPTEYFAFFASPEGGTNPWSNMWNRVAPTTKDAQGPAIGQYFATRGEEGMAPTGGDPKYQDIYGNMAPDGTYPADIDNQLIRYQEIISEGLVRALLDPYRVDIGKELFRENALDKYKIGGLAYSGIFRALKLKRNNVRNVQKNWMGSGPIEAYYFEDGVDNANHPGNRSKRYSSVNFLDPGYWD